MLRVFSVVARHTITVAFIRVICKENSICIVKKLLCTWFAANGKRSRKKKKHSSEQVLFRAYPLWCGRVIFSILILTIPIYFEFFLIFSLIFFHNTPVIYAISRDFSLKYTFFFSPSFSLFR